MNKLFPPRAFVPALVALILLLFGDASAQQWRSGYVNNYRHMFSARISPDHTIHGLGGFPFSNVSRTVCRITDYGQNWYNFEVVLNEPKPGLLDSHYITDGTAVAVGFRGTVLRTTDMWASWDSIPCDTAYDLRAVHLFDAMLGFSAGGDSTLGEQAILRTTDGGLSWDAVRETSGFVFRGIHALSASNVIAVGDSGNAVVSSDGGDSWQVLSLPLVRHWHDVHFTDPQNGLIVGGNFEKRTILRTTDGGDNWSVLMDGAGSRLRDISFLNGAVGHTVGESGGFLRTDDGGASWTAVNVTGLTTDDHLYTVHFRSEQFGIAMGEWGRFFMFTGFEAPEVVTGVVTVQQVAHVTFHGSVDTKGANAQTYVVYSTDPLLTEPDSVMGPVMNTASPTPFAIETFNLADNTTYYYAGRTKSLTGISTGATLSFHTDFGAGVSLYTGTPTDVTLTSATLHAVVANLGGESSLWFDYQRFGGPLETIAATPATVMDGQQYEVTAQLSGLEPDNTYRFRIRAVSGQSTFTGFYQQFHTGQQGLVVTLPATDMTLTSATLNGTVANLHLPSTLTFRYGPVGDVQSFSINADPYEVSDNGTYQVMADVSGLTPNMWYAYSLHAENAFGSVHGQVGQLFYSGNPEAVVTDPATGVNGTSAVLRGTVNEVVALPASVWFEYLTEGGSVTTVEAIPHQITETGPQAVHAPLGGLAPDGVYRFRIRAVDADGNEYHGKYRQAHTGQNFIPNHSFEDWTVVSGEKPDTWINILGQVWKVSPGYTGSHAVKLHFMGFHQIAGLLTAMFVPSQEGVEFVGGVPYSSRPDTLIGMFNYEVMPGDSAIAMIIFRKEGVTISEQMFRFGGSSGGQWTELRFPITFTAPDDPDTLVLGFIPIDIMSEEVLPQAGSFLVIDDLHFAGDHADIPNGGFENWTAFSFNSPDDWYYEDMLRFGYTANPGSQPLSRTGEAMEGAYAVEIRNIPLDEVTDMAVHGLYLPGRVSSSNSFFKGGPSFAVPYRPQALHGYYRFYPEAGDRLMISCALFNNGNHVGENVLYIDQGADVFTPFTLDLELEDWMPAPDSAFIEIGASASDVTPAGASRAIIDNLRFDGFAENFGIVVSAPATYTSFDLRVYPNPGTDLLTFEVNGAADGDFSMDMFDIMGRSVLSRGGRFSGGGRTSRTIDISHLPDGIYLAVIVTGNGKRAVKWVKQ